MRAAFAAAALIAGVAAAPAPQDISVVNNAKVTNTLTTTYTKVSLFILRHYIHHLVSY